VADERLEERLPGQHLGFELGLDDVGVAGDRGAGLGGGRCGGRDRRRLASVPTRTERERDPLPGLRLQKPGRVPGNQDPALGER